MRRSRWPGAVPRRWSPTAGASRTRACGWCNSGPDDRTNPEFRDRLRREAELVRGHASTREANEFLSELLDETLAGLDARKA